MLVVQSVSQWITSHGGPIELSVIPASTPQLVQQKPYMCCPIKDPLHIKDPLLLIGKSSP